MKYLKQISRYIIFAQVATMMFTNFAEALANQLPRNPDLFVERAQDFPVVTFKSASMWRTKPSPRWWAPWADINAETNELVVKLKQEAIAQRNQFLKTSPIRLMQENLKIEESEACVKLSIVKDYERTENYSKTTTNTSSSSGTYSMFVSSAAVSGFGAYASVNGSSGSYSQVDTQTEKEEYSFYTVRRSVQCVQTERIVRAVFTAQKDWGSLSSEDKDAAILDYIQSTAGLLTKSLDLNVRAIRRLLMFPFLTPTREKVIFGALDVAASNYSENLINLVSETQNFLTLMQETGYDKIRGQGQYRSLAVKIEWIKTTLGGIRSKKMTVRGSGVGFVTLLETSDIAAILKIGSKVTIEPRDYLNIVSKKYDTYMQFLVSHDTKKETGQQLEPEDTSDIISAEEWINKKINSVGALDLLRPSTVMAARVAKKATSEECVLATWTSFNDSWDVVVLCPNQSVPDPLTF